MYTTIEVDEQVYSRLRDHAEPFTDTPNSVLRRILGLDPSATARVGPSDLRPARGIPSGGGPPRRRSSAKSKKPVTSKPVNGRAPAGSTLPEVEYEGPLLASLRELGGVAPSRSVVELVGQKLSRQLTELDKEALTSGAIRWENRVQFVRLKLIDRGLMKKDTPRGVWELTEKGRVAADGTSGLQGNDGAPGDQ